MVRQGQLIVKHRQEEIQQTSKKPFQLRKQLDCQASAYFIHTQTISLSGKISTCQLCITGPSPSYRNYYLACHSQDGFTSPIYLMRFPVFSLKDRPEKRKKNPPTPKFQHPRNFKAIIIFWDCSFLAVGMFKLQC